MQLGGYCCNHLAIHLLLYSHFPSALYFLVPDPALSLGGQRSGGKESSTQAQGVISSHCCSQMTSHLLFEAHAIQLGHSSSNFPASDQSWLLAPSPSLPPSSPAIILSYFSVQCFNCYHQGLLVPPILLTSSLFHFSHSGHSLTSDIVIICDFSTPISLLLKPIPEDDPPAFSSSVQLLPFPTIMLLSPQVTDHFSVCKYIAFAVLMSLLAKLDPSPHHFSN